MSHPEILLHTYPNGLKLVAERRPDVRSAAFQLVLPAGAATEPPDREGLSKVLVDLCYRGAGDRDSRALSEALDALGLQRAAGATVETSSFGGALLADELAEALALHADIVLRPRLAESELPAVVALARQELQALEDQPARKMMVHLRRAYFTNTFGRSTLGTEESLASLTSEAMRDDYARRYLPDGAILSVAGRFEWEWLKEEVARHFGAWTGSPPPAPKPEYRSATTYAHIEQDTAQEHIGLVYSSVPPGHSEQYAAGVTIGILSGGMGARLFTEIREKRGLVYSVFASESSVRGHGFVFAYAGTTPERSQETLDVLLHELRRVVEGVTEDEVTRARTGLLSSLVMQGESTTARARAIAGDLFYLGRVRPLDEVRAGIEAVTPTSVVEHVRHTPPSNFTVMTLGPRRLSMPE